ncbi:hypothetical protein GGP41_006617 [Bipolaris sorokiniana]|uniref:Uncharacterized protein n=1 Tax=Cochliobolus sativus TaxID=45130 RepID=A0A8H6DZ80_COCSA|nr:hypothetical protein GGP41_006617 [Bipolaris sorokiniana]
MPRGVRLARNPYYSYLFLPGSVVTCQSTRAYPGILSTFFFLSTQPLTSPFGRYGTRDMNEVQHV